MQKSFKAAAALGCVAASALGGCNGCGKDKPYTPFGVVSASATSSAMLDDAGAAAGDEDAGAEKPRFAAKPATAAPANASKWTLDGRAIDAPAGRMFDRAVVADLDADQKNEIVAWTVPAGGVLGQAPGELWLYPASGAAKKILALPGFVPTSADCKHTPVLAQTGPKSVTLDVTAVCTGKVLARSPTRALVVAAPLSERATIVSLRVADAAPGETLALEVDSSDRDNDGRDDVRVAITVKANGSDRPATAELVWFDRAAGSSRDSNALSGSLGRVAAGELWRSKRKKLGASVRTGVANARRLLSTVCAEGNVPRVFADDGAPFRCGSLTTVVDRLLVSEVQAAITDDEVLLGFAALDRDGWYFGKASDKQRQDVEKQLLAKVKTVEAPHGVSVSAHPVKRGPDPRWSPLSFESSSSLLAQTSDGLVRISPTGTSEPLSEGGTVAPWPLEIARSDGTRVGQPSASCDESEIALPRRAAAGAASEPQKTALLAPRPGNCGGGGKLPTLELSPLAWRENDLDALIAGEPVNPKFNRAEAAMRPRVMGSPRSPDGKLLVTPTTLGLLVVGDKNELWRVPDSNDLRECTVADNAAGVACVHGDGIVMYTRP